MSQELLVIENLNPVEIFKAGGIGPILAMIEAEVSAEVPDTTTAKGRKAIASNAYKVSQSKTLIDKMGKTLTDSLNAQLKPINAERKLARDGLDELKDKIRQPLTIWEAREARAKEARKAAEAAKALAIQVSADQAAAEQITRAKVAAENAESDRLKALAKAEYDRKRAIEIAEYEKQAAIANEQARQAQEEAARKAELAKNKLELFIVEITLPGSNTAKYYYTNLAAAEEDKAFTLDESPEAQVTIVNAVLFTKFETE